MSSCEEKVALTTEVYDAVYVGTESFEVDNIGSDLAYLLGAILKHHKCEWSEEPPLFLVLRAAFGPEHPVWEYVQVEGVSCSH